MKRKKKSCKKKIIAFIASVLGEKKKIRRKIKIRKRKTRQKGLDR